MTTTEQIGPGSPMREVLEVFPGAQRALFRRYHIGGCSSCGFAPDETLAQVCARNGNLDVNEVLAHIQSSHEQDAKILISPGDLAGLLRQDKSVKLVDVRSREEFEAVKEMARLAREENEALKARIAALEAKGDKPGRKAKDPAAD